MALLLFCITSISAPTIPDAGAGVGGPESELSDTFTAKEKNIYYIINMLITLAYFFQNTSYHCVFVS